MEMFSEKAFCYCCDYSYIRRYFSCLHDKHLITGANNFFLLISVSIINRVSLHAYFNSIHFSLE